jgi:shikimate dehydrogenase
LSPVIHNAWIAAAGLDAAYVAFSPTREGFAPFISGCRGGAIRGLNVTAPFKEDALAACDQATPAARRAGAANLLLFEADGKVAADNTDGFGLLQAFSRQATGFDPKAGPLVMIGAGGAARGACAAFLDAGAPSIRLLNRSSARAQGLIGLFGGRVIFCGGLDAAETFEGANAIINATPTDPGTPMASASPETVVMDMVYRPLETPFLQRAAYRGLRTVDGLSMLIEQARPSFEAFFGRPAPVLDIRSIAQASLTTAE